MLKSTFWVICLTFFTLVTQAKDRKETELINRYLKREQNSVRSFYDSNFDKNRKLTGFEPRCISVFSWIQAKDYFSDKELEAYISAEIEMQTKCYSVLLGNKAEDFGKFDALEKAVELGVITEDIYLFFIHSLGYAEEMSSFQNSVRNQPMEKDADSVRAASLKRSDAHTVRLNELAQTKNFLTLAIRVGVSQKYQKKLSKLMDTILDFKKK